MHERVPQAAGNAIPSPNDSANRRFLQREIAPMPFKRTLSCAGIAAVCCEDAVLAIRNDRFQLFDGCIKGTNYVVIFFQLGDGAGVDRAGYQYPHSFKDGYVVQEYVVHPKKYYKPTSRGYEKVIKDRLDHIEQFKKQGVSRDTE